MPMLDPSLIVRRSANARIRLFCIPFAGGSAAAFAPWQAKMGQEIEVCSFQLPGRGGRIAEPAVSSLPRLVADLARVIAQQSDLPFAIFGHSMGALLAFELTRYLVSHKMALPEHLFLSGCAAPGHRTPGRNVSRLADEELIATLASYNGTPPELLANRELMELVLPTIRADFALVEGYLYVPGPILSTPVSVFGGMRDEHVNAVKAQAWHEHTSGKFELTWFPGDHFFIQQDSTAVIEKTSASLRRIVELRDRALVAT
ncbi:thioesterase II family protein [Massilia rubra]|nr:alpha/beta fold hydrolase [Massilia rubra]